MVLPAHKGPDLDDVPQSVKDQMTFQLAEEIADVLAAAFGDGRAGGRARSDTACSRVTSSQPVSRVSARQPDPSWLGATATPVPPRFAS